MLYVELWNPVQKKHSSGVSAVPESGIKLEGGNQDIKPLLTPPPGAPPPELSIAMENEMGSTRGDVTGQPAPHQPTPGPPRVLYDPTLYPPTDPVVPKQGRARALDLEHIDHPPTKKRRVEPSPTLVSTSAPPPQPKQMTLFTANKSGPITRTRDGKFVPVPTLPKPAKWGLNPEERARLGLEPLIVAEVRGESRYGAGGLSTSTSDSVVYRDITPRNQVRSRRHRGSMLLVDYMHPYGSQMEIPQQKASPNSRIRTLSLKITRKMKVIYL